jgi:DNA-binding transcriptional MerR regulator
MEKHERAYQAKEVAEKIGIANSTLRKWCRQLEAGGYRFIKDQQQHRVFTDYDIDMLLQFYDLTQGRNIGLDTAIELVVAKFNRAATRDIALPDTPEKSRDEVRYDEVMEKLERQEETNLALSKRLDKQEAFNVALLERLDKQQEYIENSIKARDEQLMTAVRELMEQRLQLAAAQEKEKKKSWWQFWK